MKNSLLDLNNHLFAQLERLNDEDIKGEALATEINRAKAVTEVAREIIANGTLVLKARTVVDNSIGDIRLPAMLGGEKS